jgi:hypothetical protein
VTFHFPDGSSQKLTFERPNWLGTSEVDPRFYHALCQLASRTEGRPVELFPNEPAQFRNGGGPPGDLGPQPGGVPADDGPMGGVPGAPGQPGGEVEEK